MRVPPRLECLIFALAIAATFLALGAPRAGADARTDELGRIKIKLEQLKADIGKTQADKKAAEAARTDALKAARDEKDPTKKKAFEDRAQRELARLRHDDEMEKDFHRQIVENDRRRALLEAQVKKEEQKKP